MANKLTKGKRRLLVDIINFKNGLVYPEQLFYLDGRLHKTGYPVSSKSVYPNELKVIQIDFSGATA